MLTALKQSTKALRGNPARTTLTTLGIVIGIAAVVLVLSAGAGLRSLIDAQIASYGTNTIFIQTRVPSANKNLGGPREESQGATITTFKPRDIDAIKKINNVVNSYGGITGQTAVSYRGNKKSVIYFGAGSARFAIDKTTLKTGRIYSQSEDDGAAQVAVLGNSLANNLFGADDPVGKLIHVGALNFAVIGVYAPSNGLGGGIDDFLFIPLTTAQKKLLGVDYVSRAVVELKDMNASDATIDQITAVLRHNHSINDPSKDDFVVMSQAQALSTFNTIFSGITILLISIAAISLIVGGVGIMNIMYVSVTERTAEVGLKKALGARHLDILKEFLFESVLVTLLGGAIGVALGALLGYLVAVIAALAHLAWNFSVPFIAIAISFCVSGTIGVSFGVFPALSAAKLDPIAALRHE